MGIVSMTFLDKHFITLSIVGCYIVSLVLFKIGFDIGGPNATGGEFSTVLGLYCLFCIAKQKKPAQP